MNKEELVQYFIDRPSLIKESKAVFVSKKFNLDLDLCREALKEAKEKTGIIKVQTKGTPRLQETLDSYGLPLDQVKRLVVYGNKDNPMYSITPREEWLNSGENIKQVVDNLLS